MIEQQPGHNVVPFARDANYLRARALSHQRAGRALEALELMRLYAERAPEEPVAQLALAEQYAEMGAPEQSNRILYALLQRSQSEADCFLLLAENYFSLQDLTRANDCALAAIRLGISGDRAERVEDLLDELEELAPPPSIGSRRGTQALLRGSRALELGEPERAIHCLTYAVAHGEDNAQTYALRAFAHLADGAPKAALRDARRAAKHEPGSLAALCAMASALHALNSPVLAATFLDQAYERAEAPQDYAMLCQSACDTGHHDLVLTLLRSLQPVHPYTPQLLHMLAAANWNIGQVQQAALYWSTLRRVVPDNTVATFYHDLAVAALPQGDVQEPPAEPVSYQMELPLEACIDRLLRLHRVVHEGQAALQRELDEDAGFAALLGWALTLQDEGHTTRRTILSLLAALRGSRAERLLLATLTDPALSEDDKRQALAALAAHGLTGPYYVEMNGRIARVMVQAAMQDALPPSCERILQGAVDRLSPAHGDVVSELSAMLLPYVARRVTPEAPLRHPQVWIAALEVAYCRRHNLPTDVPARCQVLRISPRMLEKYIARLEVPCEDHQL